MGLTICNFYFVTSLTLILRTLSQIKYSYIKKCPNSEQSWTKHSEMLNCTIGTSFKVYHCLPTNENRLIELCFQNTAISPKDGCPYFSLEQGFGISQRKCFGKRSGCPESIRAPWILSSDGYKFPSCLVIPKEQNITTTSSHQHSSTQFSTLYSFTDKVDNVKHQTEMDFITRKKATDNGSNPVNKGLFLPFPTLLLGCGLFTLICIFFATLALLQCKRMTKLRERMEAANYMSSIPYSTSRTHPYEETENEAIYDYAYNVDEGSRPVSESASYLEPIKGAAENIEMANQGCQNLEDSGFANSLI